MICRNHVDVDEGVRPCARCGVAYCADCVVLIHGEPYCATCKTEKLLDVQSGTDQRQLQLATVGKRFAAVFIDRLLFVVAVFVVVFAMAMISVTTKRNEDVLPMVIIGMVVVLYLGLVVYEALMLAYRGQTLGKMALKIKVVRPDGRPISTGQAWGRSVLRGVMVHVLALVDYIPAFATKDKTCVHDLVANTRVVEVE